MWSDMEKLAIRILCQELCRIGILIGDENELLELNIPTTFYFHGKKVVMIGRRTC
jgi:Xaa-Pro dipeptidase